MTTKTKKSKGGEQPTIAVVLDRTGSMARIALATIDGFNEFVKQQEPDALISLHQFDQSPPDPVVQTTFRGVKAKDVKPLTSRTYQPRGTTPLYDAVGEVVTDLVAAKPEGKVVVLIVTDGQENASTEWTREKVYALVDKQRQAGWEFVFMGADIDAYEQGAAMGVAGQSTSIYAATAVGTRSAWDVAAHSTSSYTTGMSSSVAMPQDYIDGDDDAVQTVTDPKPLTVTDHGNGSKHIPLG